MPDWTEELKAKVVQEYKDANPTPENTTEIVKEIADGLGDEFTPNGVRAILVKAGIYQKKATGTGKTTEGKTSGGTRVNKTEAINGLTNAIEATGLEVDDDIIGKLTGKAALYFKNIIEKVTEEAEE